MLTAAAFGLVGRHSVNQIFRAELFAEPAKKDFISRFGPHRILLGRNLSKYVNLQLDLQQDLRFMQRKGVLYEQAA